MANELTWKVTVDPALAAQAMRSIAQESRTAMAAVEAAVRKESQAAISLQRQRSAALISQWKSDTRAAEAEERARARAAEALQRQRSAALIRMWRQQEQERVRASRQAEREIEQAARASQARRSAFMAGAVGGVTALIGVSAISEIRNAASAWIDYASKLETTKIAFTTMLGSAAAAEAHLKELQAFALKTPFQFGELIDASQRMQALGFNAQQVIPILTDVGNAVAAAGGGSERLDRVVLALSQIQSKGKVMTQELNQLAEAGIPAWRMMEEQLGKSRAELIKMVEQGQISSQVFLDAFQKFSQQNFGGLMEAQSKTFTGAMSNIKDALLATSATAFAPLYERLSENARALAELSTNSKEFQANLTTAGAQVVRVWDGAVEAFYVVRDAIGLVAAAAVAQFGATVHIILATVEAARGFLLGLQAIAQFAAGDFGSAMETARRSQAAYRNATDEVTKAIESQGAVVQAVAQMWEDAAGRQIAAAARMAQAALAPPPTWMDLAQEFLRQNPAPASTQPAAGGSKKGRTKQSTFLTDATKDAEIAERELRQKIDADIFENKRALANHVRDIEEFTRRGIELSDQRHKVEIDRINDEWVAYQNALAKKLISQKEYDRKKKEIDIQTAESIQKNAEEISELEDRRDREIAEAELNAHKRSAQMAEEAGDRMIKIIQDRIERAEIAESEGEKQIADIQALGYLRRKKLLEDELDDFTTSLERKKEINDELIRLDGERADAAVRAARRIQDAQEMERPQRPRRVSDTLADAAGTMAGGAAAGMEAAGEWAQVLGSIIGQMQQFHVASKMYVVDAFIGMAAAAQDAIQAWILYGGSLGKALKQAVAAELASIAARATVQAMLHAAYAIGSLALGNFAAAGQHAIAAAKFAAVAALTGIAARGLAVSAAGAQGGGATAGSAFQSANRSGPGSTPGQPTTIDVNRRASSQPTVLVTVQLHGDIATDALETRVVNAVVRSLDLNDERLTSGVQGAARRG